MAYGEFKFDIVQHIATLSTERSGWTKEINLISFNDTPPKYELRSWDPEHQKMGKGITLEVLRDPAGDAVQLHTVQTATLHAFRQKSEEIADTARRLQDIAALKAHLLHGSIDCPDHDG